jgi:hypothetical protein
MRPVVALAALIPLAACNVAPPPLEFVPSQKSAVELRSAQTRLVQGDQDTVMRGVVGTLQDLGYRITKVESGAGTVSATREAELRMAVVVRPKDADESVVRANATVVALQKEGQVDSPQFYELDFYEPLGVSLQRQLAAVPDNVTAPDAARPTAELNTLDARKAAAKTASSVVGTLKPGSQSQ